MSALVPAQDIEGIVMRLFSWSALHIVASYALVVSTVSLLARWELLGL